MLPLVAALMHAGRHAAFRHLAMSASDCTTLLIRSPAQVRLVLVIVIAPLGVQHIVHGHHVIPLSHDATAHTPQLLQLSRMGMRSEASAIALWLPLVTACQHSAQQADRESVGSFRRRSPVAEGC